MDWVLYDLGLRHERVKKPMILRLSKLTPPSSILENIGVRDYCEYISTSEIRNLKISDELNLFRNRPLQTLHKRNEISQIGFPLQM